jgi:nitrate reductase gamma subunit
MKTHRMEERKMQYFNILAFLVFPYLALATFVIGHMYRYYTDYFHWNAKSSELLHKDTLKVPITIFHWGIILTFFGHAGGLLTPQRWLDRVGITAQMHDFIAIYTGMVFGVAALIGLLLLLWRRVTMKRILATTTLNDYVLLVLLIIVVSAGLYNVFFERNDILYTVAPWIRSIVTFTPEPGLMRAVPWSYRIHVLSALALLGFSPFTRLVHIWSVPVPYLIRKFIVFRRLPITLL